MQQRIEHIDGAVSELSDTSVSPAAIAQLRIDLDALRGRMAELPGQLGEAARKSFSKQLTRADLAAQPLDLLPGPMLARLFEGMLKLHERQGEFEFGDLVLQVPESEITVGHFPTKVHCVVERMAARGFLTERTELGKGIFIDLTPVGVAYLKSSDALPE